MIGPIYLNNQEKLANGNADFYIDLFADDLTQNTVSTGQTIALFNVVAGDLVECVKTELVTAFKDASDTTLTTTTLALGDGGGTGDLLAAQELNENGTEIIFKKGTGTRKIYATADTVDATIGSPGASKALADVDVGQVRCFFIKDRVPAS